MEGGGLGKRKADDLVQPKKPIKRLRSSALDRNGGSTDQQEVSILESIESDPESGPHETVVHNSDIDHEARISWSPSPEWHARPPGEIDRIGSASMQEGEEAENQSAASNFKPVAIPRPPPVNTLHSYFGGSSPGPNAQQSKDKKKEKGKGRKKQPKRLRTLYNYYDGTHDGIVLIADLDELRKVSRLETGAEEVTFRTKAQFQRHFDRPARSEDMDATCTMASFEPGIFRSKPRIWKMIEVEKQENWQDENNARDRIFAGLMQRVGQSDKPFRKKVASGLLSEGMGKFQTPGGERRRYHAYEEKLKAGQFNPDALILEGGAYKAIYLKLYEGTRDLTSFKAVTDKYGEDRVWLKTIDFDFMTHDQFDRNGTTFDAAEKAFCEYMGRTYEPNVFVRSSGGRWISKPKYDLENRFNFDEDLTKLETLILGEHNQGFMQPKTMKWLNPNLYEQRMRDAHLTGFVPTNAKQSSSRGRGAIDMERASDILARKTNSASAPVLRQVSRDELLSLDRIPRGAAYHEIYPQNVSKKSGYTGNYTRNWRSIKRDKKFREAAGNQEASPFETSNTQQRPEWLMTDEQRRMLKTPSPSPVQPDVSDDELFVRQGSVSDAPDDETPSSSPTRRRNPFSVMPDSSDEGPPELDHSRSERHPGAGVDDLSTRPTVSAREPSRPAHSSAGRGNSPTIPANASIIAHIEDDDGKLPEFVSKGPYALPARVLWGKLDQWNKSQILGKVGLPENLVDLAHRAGAAPVIAQTHQIKDMLREDRASLIDKDGMEDKEMQEAILHPYLPPKFHEPPKNTIYVITDVKNARAIYKELSVEIYGKLSADEKQHLGVRPDWNLTDREMFDLGLFECNELSWTTLRELRAERAALVQSRTERAAGQIGDHDAIEKSESAPTSDATADTSAQRRGLDPERHSRSRSR